MEQSGFTSEGYADSIPPLYHDSERIHEVASWSREMLEERIREYTDFLTRKAPKPMPRALETATRLLDHMMFELVQRDDHDDHLTDKDFEELLNA